MVERWPGRSWWAAGQACTHSHASLLLEQGVHLKVVQERLGHSTIAITADTYSHVAAHLQQEAAAKFDEALALELS